MTEKEFRNYLITNREWLEQSTGHELSMERIERMVQNAQETKRLEVLKKKRKNDLHSDK